jgi:hypothetical protein
MPVFDARSFPVSVAADRSESTGVRP